MSLKVASNEFKDVQDFDKGSPGHGSHRPTHVTIRIWCLTCKCSSTQLSGFFLFDMGYVCYNIVVKSGERL